MSRMVSRDRIAPVAAVLLGLVVLGMLALTVVFDSLTHYPGTGGPLRQDRDGRLDCLRNRLGESRAVTEIAVRYLAPAP
jgi:hypothetical protein